MTEVAGAYVTIRPDLSKFREELLAGLKKATAGITASVDVEANIRQAMADLGAVKATADSLSHDDPTITPEVNLGPLAAGVAAAKSMLFGLRGPSIPLGEGSLLSFGRRDSHPIVDSAIGAAAGRSGGLSGLLGTLGGFGSRVGGFLGSMFGGRSSTMGQAFFGRGGNGSGGILGFGRGLPAFGSIGSLLGFGAEHIGTLGLGIAGSAGGAALGGGLLGLGAMGVMGTGMATDAAGVGQAAGDISQAYKIMSNSMLTATQRQAQLNNALGDLTPAARTAVMAAATTAQGFHAMFDKLTGPAEAIGAQIIQQAMLVGEKFLPTLGKFAAQNMGIIKKDIQPLFSWLQNPGAGGGLGIFTNLNKIFQSNLPTSIHAFTQFIEVLGNTINTAAGYTGGFISKIDQFLTKLNTPSGLKKWDTTIGKLIGTFKVWMGFFGNLAKVIVDVFGPAMGVGTTIIKGLSDGLKSLGNWLTSGSMKDALHGLFGAHLSEVKAFGGLIKALAPDVAGFVKGLIPVLTIGAKFGTMLLKAATSVVKFANGLGLAKIIPFVTAILLANKAFGPLIGRIAQAAQMFSRLLTVNPILLGITLLVLGVYEAVKHWSAISKFAERIWHDVAGFFTNLYHDVVKAIDAVIKWVQKNWPLLVQIMIAILLPGGPIIAAVIHFHTQIAKFFEKIWRDVVGFFEDIYRDAVKALKNLWDAIQRDFGTPVHDFFTQTIPKWVGKALDFFKSLPGKIMDFLKDLPGDFLKLGEDMVKALLGAFKNIGSDIGNLVKSAASHIPGVGGLLKHIPGLAEGGIVTKPTLAVVGEAGPEFVLPMSKLAPFMNTPASLPDVTSVGAGGAAAPLNLTMPVTFSVAGQDLEGVLAATIDTRAEKVVAKSLNRVVALKRQGVRVGPVLR